MKEQKETVPDGTRVCVYLRGGRYEFDEVLSFTEEDLGNVSYVAYDKEEVVFSGAKAVSGFTEETANGVRVFTKTLNPGTDITDFKSLFSQTEQLPVPRYPESGYFTVKKLDPDNDLWTEETTKWDLTLGQRSFFADPADLKTDFTNYRDVQVRILHYWHDELMYLTDFNRATGRIGLSRPSSMKIRDIDRYYFENVFEALNEPGEWYLNRTTNKLYYVPKAGESADTLVLYASNQELLVDINGVDGLTFEGIRFTQTDWNVPSPLNTDWDASWRIEYQHRGIVRACVSSATISHNGSCDYFGGISGERGSTIEYCLAVDVSITARYNKGSITGSIGTNFLSRNYYYQCSVSNLTENIGIGTNTSHSQDITYKDGAVEAVAFSSKPAGIGAQTASYPGGITVYEHGLAYKGVYYIAKNRVEAPVNITLVQGTKDGVTAWWGTFYDSTTGYTLSDGAAAYTLGADYTRRVHTG